MKPESRQLDLFSADFQETEQSLPEEAHPVASKRPALAKTELRPIRCGRCGEWLCDALAGARAYCARCRVWSGNG